MSCSAARSLRSAMASSIGSEGRLDVAALDGPFPKLVCMRSKCIHISDNSPDIFWISSSSPGEERLLLHEDWRSDARLFPLDWGFVFLALRLPGSSKSIIAHGIFRSMPSSSSSESGESCVLACPNFPVAQAAFTL
jgi:hypothetical protein